MCWPERPASTKHTRALAVCGLLFSAGAAILLALAPPPAQAADAFHLGKWKIVSAEVAPWAKGGPVPDPAESKTLVGETITLMEKEIRGPGSFPCKGPSYELIEGSPEILFQGMFGEMKRKDPSVDPQQLAEQMGFRGKIFRTVLTGCEFAVDFSFGSDPNLAYFALDNYLYRMDRN